MKINTFNLFIILFNLLFNLYYTMKINETEILLISYIQSTTLSTYKNILSSIIKSNKLTSNIKSIPSLFEQQDGVLPPDNNIQLNNFGLKIKWFDLLTKLNENKKLKLLIMIRHAEAYENLNPYNNTICNFILDDRIINNFDSEITDNGYIQSNNLNNLFQSISPNEQSNNQNITWFETIGLKNQIFFTSPLSRTMQTSNSSLYSLPIADIIASEILRASIGTDVCNSRHSVYTSTSEHSLPPPFNTGCNLPDESLLDIYTCTTNLKSNACKYPTLPFKFPIRPPGGNGIGLISDSDQLWRYDSVDDSHILRSLTFLKQLYEYYPDNQVIGVVTHGEMIQAIYESLGEFPYPAKNTQVVPLLIELIEEDEEST